MQDLKQMVRVPLDWEEEVTEKYSTRRLFSVEPRCSFPPHDGGR